MSVGNSVPAGPPVLCPRRQGHEAHPPAPGRGPPAKCPSRQVPECPNAPDQLPGRLPCLGDPSRGAIACLCLPGAWGGLGAVPAECRPSWLQSTELHLSPPPPPPRTHSPVRAQLGCGGRGGAGPATSTLSQLLSNNTAVLGSFCLSRAYPASPPPPQQGHGGGGTLPSAPGRDMGGGGLPSTCPRGREGAQSETERGTGTSPGHLSACGGGRAGSFGGPTHTPGLIAMHGEGGRGAATRTRCPALSPQLSQAREAGSERKTRK